MILGRAARVTAAALFVALFAGRLRKPEASVWPQSHALLGTRHAAVLDEIFPGQCHQLPFSGMVDGFPADDLLEKRGAVLPDIVSKAGLRLMRADHQHVGDAGQGIAHLGEEFVFGANRASVLSGGVNVRLDSYGVGVLCIEVQDLGRVVIDMEGSAQG